MSLRGKETPSFCAGVGEWWRFFSFSTGGGEPVATVCLVSSIGDVLGSTFSSTFPGIGESVATVCSVSLVGDALGFMFSPASPRGGEFVATVRFVCSVEDALGSMFSPASERDVCSGLSNPRGVVCDGIVTDVRSCMDGMGS